jgi:hypothetical protein
LVSKQQMPAVLKLGDPAICKARQAALDRQSPCRTRNFPAASRPFLIAELVGRPEDPLTAKTIGSRAHPGAGAALAWHPARID